MVSQHLAHYSKWKNSNIFFQDANRMSSCRAPDDEARSFSYRHRLTGGLKLAYLLLIISVTLGNLIKSNEARLLVDSSDEDMDWDCKEYPCICDDVFFRFCPDKDYCRSRRLPKYSDRLPAEFAEPSNNIFDPDHLEPTSVTPRRRLGAHSFYAAQEAAPDMDQDNGKIVTVRKVKIEEPQPGSDIHIHPVRVRIPVKVNDELSMMPPVKHMYRMNEYTTEEKQLETEMVPVTETVIKPVNIGKDQIVDSVRA